MGLRAEALKRFVPAWEVAKKFTPEQSKVMGEFRQTLEREGLLSEWWDNKLIFARFCEARQFDLEKALTLFRSHVEWRKTVDLDAIVATAAGPVPRLLTKFRFPEMTAAKQACAFSHHKTSRQGFPMYYDRLGAIDLPQLKQVSSVEVLLNYMVWYQEATSVYRLPAASLKAGRLISTSVYVMDMSGFAVSKFNAELRAVVKALAKIGSDQYPQTMEKTFIVNTPVAFRIVWNFVSPLLDARIRSSINILGKRPQYLPELLKYVDEADLPAFLGGSDESIDFVHEVGPWAEHLPAIAT